MKLKRKTRWVRSDKLSIDRRPVRSVSCSTLVDMLLVGAIPSQVIALVARSRFSLVLQSMNFLLPQLVFASSSALLGGHAVDPVILIIWFWQKFALNLTDWDSREFQKAFWTKEPQMGLTVFPSMGLQSPFDYLDFFQSRLQFRFFLHIFVGLDSWGTPLPCPRPQGSLIDLRW